VDGTFGEKDILSCGPKVWLAQMVVKRGRPASTDQGQKMPEKKASRIQLGRKTEGG